MDAVPYTQGYIFFVTFLGGIVIALIWDLYRIFRYYISLGKKGTAVGDILFWLICLGIGLRIIVYSSWGNLRWFMFLGFLLGGAFYFYAFSKAVLKILIYVVKIIILFIMFIWFLISYPFILLQYQIEKFTRPYKYKLNKNINFTKKRYKFFKYRLKRVLNDKKIEYNYNKDKKAKFRKYKKITKKNKKRNKKLSS